MKTHAHAALALLFVACQLPDKGGHLPSDDSDADTDPVVDTDVPPDTDPPAPDADADGVPDAEDCAPTDPERFPGNEEWCDAIDNDCDASTTEQELITWTDAQGVHEDWTYRLANVPADVGLRLDTSGHLRLCGVQSTVPFVVDGDVEVTIEAVPGPSNAPSGIAAARTPLRSEGGAQAIVRGLQIEQTYFNLEPDVAVGEGSSLVLDRALLRDEASLVVDDGGTLELLDMSVNEDAEIEVGRQAAIRFERAVLAGELIHPMDTTFELTDAPTLAMQDTEVLASAVIQGGFDVTFQGGRITVRDLYSLFWHVVALDISDAVIVGGPAIPVDSGNLPNLFVPWQQEGTGRLPVTIRRSTLTDVGTTLSGPTVLDLLIEDTTWTITPSHLALRVLRSRCLDDRVTVRNSTMNISFSADLLDCEEIDGTGRVRFEDVTVNLPFEMLGPGIQVTGRRFEADGLEVYGGEFLGFSAVELGASRSIDIRNSAFGVTSSFLPSESGNVVMGVAPGGTLLLEDTVVSPGGAPSASGIFLATDGPAVLRRVTFNPQAADMPCLSVAGTGSVVVEDSDLAACTGVAHSVDTRPAQAALTLRRGSLAGASEISVAYDRPIVLEDVPLGPMGVRFVRPDGGEDVLQGLTSTTCDPSTGCLVP